MAASATLCWHATDLIWELFDTALYDVKVIGDGNCNESVEKLLEACRVENF
jgi:hypothetical protein